MRTMLSRRSWYIKRLGEENMSHSESMLARKDAEDCARWVLSEIATRASSKHQKAPFVAIHMARQTVSKCLRGSDLSERLYVSVEVLKRAGFTRKEALVIVTEKAQKFLGKSKRGRPRLDATKPDFMSTMASVQSMVNAFARRKQYTEGAVDRWVGQFVWGRTVGVIRGAEFDPESGRKMHEAQLEATRQLRRLRGF